MSLKSDLTLSECILYPVIINHLYLFIWQNRKGFPLLVSGVPPDFFSETGQLWGRFDANPIINVLP